LVFQNVQSEVPMSFWPNNCAGAISLTFDDGMSSQLVIAFPTMQSRGIRGTFYLNPRGSDEQSGLPWREALEPWQPVALAGNEIGNHSIHHPCTLNIDIDREWGRSGINLQRWTLERIEADVLEAQRRIATAFPYQSATSFAYPCYETEVGRGVTRTSYVPAIARHFVAGRAGGELANDPRYCDLHRLSSWPVEFSSGSGMIGMIEQTIARGRWGILTFHGINEGRLSVSNVAFVELVDHLVRRQDAVWVAPVAEVATYIETRMAS
jgi:peptidoglycan/xylan/chitin deacetylase (PgdA/CDA1 family)